MKVVHLLYCTLSDKSQLKCLQSKFDINISLPWVKRYAIKMFRAAFLKFRYGLKKHFDKFSTVEEALENKPEAVKTQEEWDFLCTRFSSQELQVLDVFCLLSNRTLTDFQIIH